MIFPQKGVRFIATVSYTHRDVYKRQEKYLTFEHDEFTMKPTLDADGRRIPRLDYRIASLNCGGEDFAVACMRANLRYGKNQKREDVKIHHYIISFDPVSYTHLDVYKRQHYSEPKTKR